MKEKQTGELITEGKKLRENKALKSVIHQTYQRILHQSKNLTRNLENLKLIDQGGAVETDSRQFQDIFKR